MSIAPNLTEKICFMPCPSNIIEAGQCACHNRIMNNSLTKTKIPTAEELALQMQHDLGYEDLTDPVKFASLVAIEYAKLHLKAALDAAESEAPSHCAEGIRNCYSSSLIQ